MALPKTDKEYLAKLKKAASIPTIYWAKWPYNLGYVHANGNTSFDCVNLNKAILNGWEAGGAVGSFVHNLSRTGDCDEWGFISQTEYSADFEKLKKENLIAALYMPGHIGNRIPPEEINGKTYNCIECTGAWGGGVVYSFVSKEGYRYNHKGGSRAGRWTLWGKMTKWLKYTSDPEPEPTKYKVGDTVQISKVHVSSTDNKPLTPAIKKGKILLIVNGRNPYLIDNIGWVNDNEIIKKVNPKKTIDDLAVEVIAGKWGVMPERKQRLEAAGYDYASIQKRVNELLK